MNPVFEILFIFAKKKLSRAIFSEWAGLNCNKRKYHGTNIFHR